MTQAVPTRSWTRRSDAILKSLLKGAPQGLRESKKLLNRELLADIDARGTDTRPKLSSRPSSAPPPPREAMLAFLNRKKDSD